MIACVSHSGTWEDEKVSEDEILAKNVPDIDLIVSGHTHTQLAEPKAFNRFNRFPWKGQFPEFRIWLTKALTG